MPDAVTMSIEQPVRVRVKVSWWVVPLIRTCQAAAMIGIRVNPVRVSRVAALGISVRSGYRSIGAELDTR